LGITQEATNLEVTRAYRRKALLHHPDKNPNNADATRLFQEVSEAYITLSDEKLRAQYDREIGIVKRNAYGWGGHEEDNDGDEEDDDNDTLDEKSVQDLAQFISGTLFKYAPNMCIPLNQNEVMHVTLEECFSGCIKKLRLSSHTTRCKTCIGTGTTLAAGSATMSSSMSAFVLNVLQNRPRFARCTQCKGRGIIEHPIELDIQVPPGSKSGDKVLLKGYGSAHQTLLGLCGDLIVTFQQSVVHPRFHRHPDVDNQPFDLIVQETITLREALCGFTRTVEHVDGTLFTFQSETETVYREGDYISLPGLGMPRVQSTKEDRGCLHVRLKVEMPCFKDIRFSIGVLEAALP
jgi:DnaJ-class molecular chaperone